MFDGRFVPSASQRSLPNNEHSRWTPNLLAFRKSLWMRVLTCRIANLCISPVQAGIMLFSTPNSSFILDLLRRSIRLCAVLRAIFRPATLVADGCFFLFEVLAPALAVGPLAASPSKSRDCSCCPRGFICIIFRERVGGGGKVKTSLALACAAEERRREAPCM